MRDRECVLPLPALSFQDSMTKEPSAHGWERQGGGGREVRSLWAHLLLRSREKERERLEAAKISFFLWSGVGPGRDWGTKVKSVNGLQNFPLKALLILSSQSLDGERGKSLCGSVDLMKVKAELPFDLDLKVNSNLLLARSTEMPPNQAWAGVCVFPISHLSYLSIFSGMSQVFRHA